MQNNPDVHIKEIEKYFSKSDSSDYRPDIFPLGYHVKRNEPRLIYVMPLTMTYEGESIAVKSKNFSATGLQIFIPRKLIVEGKTVQLTFEQFKKEYHADMGDESVNFDSINYLIKSVQHLEQKTYISLIQLNLSESTRDFFSRFVSTNRLRYKIDATDRIYASKAQYYENLYTNNMPHIPMFIRWNKTNGLYIDTIIKSERNHHFFNYINDDLRPFCLPQRIEKFVVLARQHQSSLFFSYWIDGELHSIFDFEIKTSSDLLHIITKVKNLKGRIYKVATNLNKKPTAEKITSMLSKIQALDIMESKIFAKRVNETIAQIVLSDITRFYLRNIFSAELLNNNTPKQALSSSVLVNNEMISMIDGHVIHQYDEAVFKEPENIYFRIEKNRYDERYLYSMDIEIRFNRKKYSAKSIDFSRTGLGIVIRQAVDLNNMNDILDHDIKLSFSSLMNQKNTIALKHISYRVVIARQMPEGLFLGLIRNTSYCNPNINRFFSDLAKHSKDTLELCVKDKTENIYTTFYEAFFTENIETIPILIARDKINRHYIREIGLTNPPCHLAENFYIKDQGYNYRSLTSRLRLDELHQRTMQASEKNSKAFMLFIFKGIDRQGYETIFSVTDFEIIHHQDLNQIIKIVLDNNGACIQIQFINNLLVNKQFRKITIDKVDLLNKASGKLLTKEYNEIIGFAEMIDLSSEYRQSYQSSTSLSF